MREGIGETLLSLGDYVTAYSYTPKRLGQAGEMSDQSGLVNLRARWYDTSTGRFISKDTWAGDYRNPITLVKWLYANANPVIYTDPSGYSSTVDAIIIHQMIENHYLVNFAEGRDVRSNYLIPGASKNKTGYSGYADIADRTLQQLYEIKPILSEKLGTNELQWYLSFLSGWTPGTIYSYVPVEIGPWPFNPLKTVYAEMNTPGVIVYWGQYKFETVPVPVPIPNPNTEVETNKNQNRQGVLDLQPVLQACGRAIMLIIPTIIVLVLTDGTVIYQPLSVP